MKIKGFLAILLLAAVVVYFVYFAKVGVTGKGALKTQVEAYSRMKTQLTIVSLDGLAREVQNFATGEQGLPEDLQGLRRSRPLGAGIYDAWGREIRYERISDSAFRLRSAGLDGVYGTSDDIVKEY
jgi:hypothetical protein